MNAVAALPASSARAGWRAHLQLEFAAQSGRTRLVGRQHEGPLLVQRPFYPEGGTSHIYIVHPPGGVVGGDELRLDVHAGPGARVLLTTPAAGKFYRSAGAQARLHQQLVLDDAELEWLPQENIFYPGTLARIDTEVRLTRGSRFIGWEFGCFGLPASNAAFERGELQQQLRLTIDGVPSFIERVRTDAGMLRATWGLAGNISCGTLLAWPADESQLALMRTVTAPAGVRFGATLVDGVLVCRLVAARADWLRAMAVELWRELRPALLSRPAVAPRIWAT